MSSSSDDDYVPDNKSSDDMSDTDDSVLEDDYVPENHEPFYNAKDDIFNREVTCGALEMLGKLKIDIELQSGSKIEHDLDEWLATSSIDEMSAPEIVTMFERYDDPRTRAPLRSLFGSEARDVFAFTVSSHGFLPVHKEVLSSKLVLDMLLDRIDRHIGEEPSWEAVAALNVFSRTFIPE